jgi:acylphosphatase
MDREPVRARVLIGGRVQGVAFRFFAEKTAARRGVTGWVRNLDDGRVEVLAEGPGPAVADFLTDLRSGPRLARVETFEVRRETATGEFGGFRIVFTAGD